MVKFLFLGVIRARETPFLDLVRSRPDLKILTVKTDNRDDVLKELLILFKEAIA